MVVGKEGERWEEEPFEGRLVGEGGVWRAAVTQPFAVCLAAYRYFLSR